MIKLPWPPTINTYYSVARGRKILSKRGRRYKIEAKICLLEQRVNRDLVGPYTICIHARPPDKRKRDLDNILKVLLDSLTEYGAISDDSQIDDLRIIRFAPVKGGEISILLSGGRGEY